MNRNSEPWLPLGTPVRLSREIHAVEVLVPPPQPDYPKSDALSDEQLDERGRRRLAEIYGRLPWWRRPVLDPWPIPLARRLGWSLPPAPFMSFGAWMGVLAPAAPLLFIGFALDAGKRIPASTVIVAGGMFSVGFVALFALLGVACSAMARRLYGLPREWNDFR